jgi:hypothetical protein
MRGEEKWEQRRIKEYGRAKSWERNGMDTKGLKVVRS